MNAVIPFGDSPGQGTEPVLRFTDGPDQRIDAPVRGSGRVKAGPDVRDRGRNGGVPYWFVYIARCSDDTVYVGIARDVTARIARHDAGKGARYTRGRTPLRVLATRRCRTQGDALRLEQALKGLGRDQKFAVAGSRGKLARLAKGCAR